MMKSVLRYIILLFLPLSLQAQDIEVKAQYPPVVTVGEQFAISWNVNSSGGEFIAPAFTGFYKLAGPQTSYSESMQMINAKVTRQTSYTYVYYLQASAEGKYTLGPGTIRIKNKEYRSDSIYIEVVKDQAAAQPQQPGNQDLRDATGDRIPGTDLFIRLIVNKNDVYQGEHLVATLKLYSRVDLGGLNEVKYPDFSGFVKEDLQTPQLRSLQRENVNGAVYGTGVIQQFLLYPQTTGEITINPVELTVLIQQKSASQDPFFSGFFDSYTNVPKVIVSQPVKITVKPLPGNKPADFSGIVGKIELSSGINKDSVNVNDAVNLKITVSGSGNLRFAGKPSLKLPADIELYEPKITDNIKNNASGSSGQKSFEYVLIPRHYGSYTIPAVSYSYFNPETRRYERLTTREFTFYTRKSSDQGAPVTVYGGVSKEDVKYLGKDIRFIKNDPGVLKKVKGQYIRMRSFYSWFALSFFIFLAILVLRRETIRRNSDISAVRNRKAAKVAGKRLNEASKCLKTGMTDRFYEEILKALWGYLSDKLSIPVSELTRLSAVDSLRDNGVDEEIIQNLAAVLDKCEFVRYAPASSGSEATDIYNASIQFIKSIENIL
jgi:hypothetical protein